MLYADFLQDIGSILCFGFLTFLAIIFLVLYSIGSATEAICKSETVKEIAKGIAEYTVEQLTDSAAEDIARWFRNDE